jgi:hypothetical protein
MELADALLENTSVTYLALKTENYTKSSAEAMAKYVRTSKHLQRIQWDGEYRVLRHRQEILCCCLLAIHESTSLKELDIKFDLTAGPSNRAFERMLAHTLSLRSLSLSIPSRQFIDVTAVRSGLKKNTTLRELTLEFSHGATTLSSILTSLLDHPLLRRLCLRGYGVELTGLEPLLLSDTSRITELSIHRLHASSPMMGLNSVLQALVRRPALTKLELRGHRLNCDEARLLRLVLCSISSLQSLALTDCILGRAELAELAPALYRNTSIKVLDISWNCLNDMESAEILRDILGSNKTITTSFVLEYFRENSGRCSVYCRWPGQQIKAMFPF